MPVGTDEQKVLTEATGKNIVNKLEGIRTILKDLYDVPSLDALIERSIVNVKSEASSIGDNAFYNCTSLTTVSFPVATSIVTNAFRGCTSLETASFPEVTSIGDNAFQSCTSLTTISFPVATSIGNNAFQGCTSLETASFPEATSIGNSAFYGCTSFNSLTLSSTTKCSLSNTNAFNNTPFASNKTGGTLYVPADLISTYQSDTKWSTVLGWNANNQILAIS